MLRLYDNYDDASVTGLARSLQQGYNACCPCRNSLEGRVTIRTIAVLG